ncbi:MAG: tripeptide aminopeptidase [Alphaproteobacteria bacterium]|jgi:tripeptide aminopeptidase
MIEQAIEDLMALLPIEAAPGKEAAVASALRDRLIDIGVPPDKIRHDNAQAQSEYGGEVGNLIVEIDGNHPSPRLMFSSHMDTVPDAVGCKPRRDTATNRIVNDAPGRALGGDNRLSCAILLTLARHLVPLQGDHAPVTLVFFIQEEVGLIGARGLDTSMLGTPSPAMCINLDGGPVHELVTAVTGTERFTIDIAGIPAHAGRPAGGVSAGVIMSLALADLQRAGWHGPIERNAGRGSANLGTVNGGQGSNVVMPALSILAEARSHDPEFRQQIITAWKDAFTAAAAELTNDASQTGSVTFGPGPTYESFALSDDEPVVKLTVETAKRCGFDIKTVTNNGGMDANWIVRHGIPAVTVAVGQRQVHTADEWIHLDDFEKACRLVVAIGTDGHNHLS